MKPLSILYIFAAGILIMYPLDILHLKHIFAE